MESPEVKTFSQAYDYEALETYFKDIAPPQEITMCLDQLLYFLVYYEHKEGVQGFFSIYSQIFELKQVLQTMIKTKAHGNN